MTLKPSISDHFARRKQISVLIDPDTTSDDQLLKTIKKARDSEVDYFFVGGSLLFHSIEPCIRIIKQESDIPVLIFPGNALQLSSRADGILLLSLVSGRNPEYLIGQHVLAAPGIRSAGLEVLPTAYMLIENGKTTSVEYMSNTRPIPSDKHDIILATAMASEMLGLKYCYLEAGSGASHPVNPDIISSLHKELSIPLIVGGGIDSGLTARKMYEAGASLLVIGNALEKDLSLLPELANARNS